MEYERHRSIFCKESLKFLVIKAIWMIFTWTKSHKVYHINDPKLKFRKMLSDYRNSRERLQSRHVSGASNNCVRVSAFVVACPRENSYSFHAMANRFIYGEPLRHCMLAGYDYINFVYALKAFIHNSQ